MSGPRWAVMVRVGHKRDEEYDVFNADTLDLQRSAGWEFLVYEDEIFPAKPATPDTAQSNPNRAGDPGGD